MSINYHLDRVLIFMWQLFSQIFIGTKFKFICDVYLEQVQILMWVNLDRVLFGPSLNSEVSFISKTFVLTEFEFLGGIYLDLIIFGAI